MSICPRHTQVKDYRTFYSGYSIDLKEELFNIFPRTGQVLCHLAIGVKQECHYLNYSGQRLYSNRLFIDGLFSLVSLRFSLENIG